MVRAVMVFEAQACRGDAFAGWHRHGAQAQRAGQAPAPPILCPAGVEGGGSAAPATKSTPRRHSAAPARNLHEKLQRAAPAIKFRKNTRKLTSPSSGPSSAAGHSQAPPTSGAASGRSFAPAHGWRLAPPAALGSLCPFSLSSVGF